MFSKRNYEWCEQKKEWLLQSYINLLKNMSCFYLEEGLYQNAIDKLHIALGKAPFDEVIHRNLLMAYHKQKNRASLIKCHEEFKKILIGEMNIEPQAETRDLFLKLVAE